VVKSHGCVSARAENMCGGNVGGGGGKDQMETEHKSHGSSPLHELVARLYDIYQQKAALEKMEAELATELKSRIEQKPDTLQFVGNFAVLYSSKGAVSISKVAPEGIVRDSQVIILITDR
jgi:hypothetical protein